jgi:Zn ribbon nucleic-acid-binding protein
MSRKKATQTQTEPPVEPQDATATAERETPPTVEPETPPTPGDEPTATIDEEAPPTAKPVYDFAHGKRCPTCKGTDTIATSTQGDVQYRQCRRVGCRSYRKNYTVVGKEV